MDDRSCFCSRIPARSIVAVAIRHVTAVRVIGSCSIVYIAVRAPTRNIAICMRARSLPAGLVHVRVRRCHIGLGRRPATRMVAILRRGIDRYVAHGVYPCRGMGFWVVVVKLASAAGGAQLPWMRKRSGTCSRFGRACPVRLCIMRSVSGRHFCHACRCHDRGVGGWQIGYFCGCWFWGQSVFESRSRYLSWGSLGS